MLDKIKFMLIIFLTKKTLHVWHTFINLTVISDNQFTSFLIKNSKNFIIKQ